MSKIKKAVIFYFVAVALGLVIALISGFVRGKGGFSPVAASNLLFLLGFGYTALGVVANIFDHIILKKKLRRTPTHEEFERDKPLFDLPWDYALMIGGITELFFSFLFAMAA